jgi:hypothetical protein
LHRHRQIYFTSRTLSGNKSLFAFDTGSRHPSPTGPCIAVARFISPAALCLGAEFSASRTTLRLDLQLTHFRHHSVF